jgi:hypothetical protein
MGQSRDIDRFGSGGPGAQGVPILTSPDLTTSLTLQRSRIEPPLHNTSREPIGIALHVTAGAILLLFAASHLGFVFIHDLSHDLQNPVFPFLSNRALYALSAVVETLLGVVCIRRAGHVLTNVGLLTFVATFFWYRWAFEYNGGTHCGCLGLLGRLFHVSKTSERAIPIATLVFLVIATVPWLYRCSRQAACYLLNRKVILFFATLAACNVALGQTVEVLGGVELQDYNPRTGSLYTNQHARSTFAVTLSGKAWRVCITNSDWPRWSAQLVFDGTNTYTILPFSTALHIPFGGFSGTPASASDRQAVSIEPSPRFIQEGTENMGLSLLWITYGFPCDSTNKAAPLEVPLSGARHHLASFGYRWNVFTQKGGRFVERCDMVRDTTLDLSLKNELFRRELDYPETLVAYNQHRLELASRSQLPSGFVKARYRCCDVFETNGISIPVRSTYEVFDFNFASPSKPSRPSRVIALKTTAVNLRQGTECLLPVVSATTQVKDYRYKETDRVRMFKYAEYTLNPGDAWRSGSDPEILARVTDWMKHGPKLHRFGANYRTWTAWAVLLVLALPLVFTLFRRKEEAK